VEAKRQDISFIVSKTQTIKNIRELSKIRNRNIDDKVLMFGGFFFLFVYFIIGRILKDEDTVSIVDGNVIFVVSNTNERDIHIFVIGV
jgi:hypothetical protein